MKINGAGPGKEDFEPALQQYEYSDNYRGMPVYTMTGSGKKCKIFYDSEEYPVGLRSKQETGSSLELNLHVFKDVQRRKFWKVISLCCCV